MIQLNSHLDLSWEYKAHDAQRHSSFGARSQRIVILRAGAIGDTLMVTPLVRALRQTFPDAYLGFICSSLAHDILRFNPHLDEVIPIAHRHMPLWLSLEKRRVLRHLRGIGIDGLLAFETHSDFIDFANRTGARRIITYGAAPAGAEQALFENCFHSIENHLRSAKGLGVEAAGLEMEMYYPPTVDESIAQRLAQAGISRTDLVVGIHPGWGSRRIRPGTTRLRSWPPERFARIIEWLVNHHSARVVATGSSKDRAFIDHVIGLSKAPALNLAGKLSLLDLAALIRRLNLYLSIDSGPAHMAAALGTPLISLWGPGIFEATRPMESTGPVQILYHPPACAPCYGTPRRRLCKDNICMNQIKIDEVKATVEQMLFSLQCAV